MIIPPLTQTVLTNLPVQGEMLDENGHLTQQWRLFFQALYTRIGGQLAPSNAVLAIVSNATNGNVAGLTSTSNANATTVAGLSTTSASNATTVTGLAAATASNTTAIQSLITATNSNTTSIASLLTTTNQNTAAIAALNAAPAAVMPVTVTASPFSYKALNKGAVAVSGGTVQSIQLTRDGTAFYNVGLVDGIIAMSTNDSVVVTYTTAPVMTFFPT